MIYMASSANSSRGIAAIVGVGPKLGRSIARKFAHHGYTVAILARDLERLWRVAEEIAREEKAQVFAIRMDCSDSKSVREAFEGVHSVGFVEVLVYNAYQPQCWKRTCFQDVGIDSFHKSLAVSSIGAFHCAQHVLTGMMERGRGTILFTGCFASLHGIAGFSDLCCGKFALRALSQCLAREFQPQGVHVVHVIIDGLVGPPTRRGESMEEEEGKNEIVGGEGSMSMDPDAVAQTYWHLHIQHRTAWTHEIDLRSSTSSFF
ncbi:3-ketodihydrosphingosine reductase [Senna tora]|uniref:3-ketodihydrosphingosine reductase n=1 Tax=Senna tora TaxID=362788 RepID=A0A834SW49_9FABA|nr:3-ketodihydrosphingosine reductase [Senna tora]